MFIEHLGNYVGTVCFFSETKTRTFILLEEKAEKSAHEIKTVSALNAWIFFLYLP